MTPSPLVEVIHDSLQNVHSMTPLGKREEKVVLMQSTMIGLPLTTFLH